MMNNKFFKIQTLILWWSYLQTSVEWIIFQNGRTINPESCSPHRDIKMEGIRLIISNQCPNKHPFKAPRLQPLFQSSLQVEWGVAALLNHNFIQHTYNYIAVIALRHQHGGIVRPQQPNALPQRTYNVWWLFVGGKPSFSNISEK